MVGRGLGWQISDLKKILKKKIYSEINLKKGNPTFLPNCLAVGGRRSGGEQHSRRARARGGVGGEEQTADRGHEEGTTALRH